MGTVPTLAIERKHLWQSPAVIALVALALRIVAVGLFYHSTRNDYEDHLWFARVGQN